ncbi:hypothetical protein [Herbiconiux sp. UC225_62]|uniref:hypothetical protein n=1 Tax=Herbiconiux sp. UC225_62 TaxID=3350168 RepID=UPI0036D3378B
MAGATETSAEPKRGVDRRALLRGAAWSVPVVALAVATPAAAASDIEVGAYSLNGACGTPGVLGPGFILTAGPGGIPVGTTILVTGSGVANIGVFSVSGSGTASVAVLSGTSRLITITGAVPGGATIAFRTTLSTSVAFTLNAATTLPADYIATGAKSTAKVVNTLVLCTAS